MRSLLDHTRLCSNSAVRQHGAPAAIPFILFARLVAQELLFVSTNTLDKWWKDGARTGWTASTIFYFGLFGPTFSALQGSCTEL